MSEQYTICQIEIGENKFDIDSKYWNNQTSLKTINGESLFGDGDINITLGDDNENFVRSTINIDYASLLELIEENRLVPGQKYRIIDYVTTTSQEDTQSAGHQFDIIVTADNENTLNEIARACLHGGDTYFSDAGANLEAWQIWYCIDNDVDRFEWAMGYSYDSDNNLYEFNKWVTGVGKVCDEQIDTFYETEINEKFSHFGYTENLDGELTLTLYGRDLSGDIDEGLNMSQLYHYKGVYNVDGKELNSAGFVIIDFGLSKHNL